MSGTRDIYQVGDVEGQLRNPIIAKMTDAFAASQVPFLDMAANQGALAEKINETLKPSFTEYGLTLDSFVVENLSLPDELQKVLRSEEHTSELQSHLNLVCRLLLEKKNKY